MHILRMASTRSQTSRNTRSSKNTTSASEASLAMEVDDVVSGLQQLSNPTDFSKDKPTMVNANTAQPISANVQPTPQQPNTNERSDSFKNLLDAAASSAMETEQHADSSSDSSSSESSDSSDSDDSSEADPDIASKNKLEDQEDLQMLEKMFNYAREVLYHERMCAIDKKLEEVRFGKAKEYLGPLEQLQETMKINIEVCSKRREFRRQNLDHKIKSEELATEQNYENDKQILQDRLKSDLEEKIRKLEEDRNNDFSSDLWFESSMKKKKKNLDQTGDKKKKPCVVTGPYIVYMLNEVDIMEDWTVVKKALAAPKRRIDPFVF